MVWSGPRILALAPAGLDGTAVVVAGSRAGGLGLLDTTQAPSPDHARAALRGVERLLNRPFGIRATAASLHQGMLHEVPTGLGLIVCLSPGPEEDPGALARVGALGRPWLVEVTSTDEARVAIEAGAWGLIAAGHEAGGLVAEATTPILLQSLRSLTDRPIWVRGGIAPHGAAGLIAAGATGVVLEGALLLARESPLSEPARSRISQCDGGETALIRHHGGRMVRVLSPPGSEALAGLRVAARESESAWRAAVRSWVGWGEGQARPIGQDAAFAADLARRFVTVGGIVREVERAIEADRELAFQLKPLGESAALARSHGTRFPIVQGPMTRVSDTIPFAEAVANGGALPFLALAMMRGPQVRALLAEAATCLADRPWGVGILGFMEPALREEQLEAIRAANPPFALIAGGRPDQAEELESRGIATYLHVPSPDLLRQYLRAGSRRFVLEGRECGGHVGPRSSLVLWEQAIGVLLDSGISEDDFSSLHVLFAGGIHDARTSAMVATMAAPLAERGVRVGVLVGTAYLFTEEAVATGAVVPGFQDEAVRCRETVLLDTGPGHEVRVSPTPFARAFEAERRRLIEEGATPATLRAELERLNAGRLRVAAKGVDRSAGAGSPLVAVEPRDQYERGVFMLGQAATLRDRATTISELHADLSLRGTAILEEVSAPVAVEAARPSDIAIIGMSALFPGAGDVRTFWENTLSGLDAIIEIPPDRWDWRTYYDPDPRAPDKVISRWGGFVPDVPFDPLRYGMPPTSLPSIEPVQLLTLEAVRAAIEDSGYGRRPFPRERTSVVLGIGGGSAQLAMGYAFRSYLPMLDAVSPGAGAEALAACKDLLPEWTEDSFPGFLLNVAAGRVANRFDLGGSNYTVDAACGSSLAAANLAVRELETGAADLVILGGADTVQNPLTYLAFSKTQAFSPRGRCRPFDASADGIVISEGVSAIVLKRLADAERDGDRIYAVIKGLGSSSDGRARGLTAPRPEGQIRAIERAYAKAGVDPATVGYVETHGTGTAVGDVVELNALADVFRASGAASQRCAVGSVKSSIGHTKCAAGMAGLINAALALHHRVLPPTIGVQTPNPRAQLESSPFHVSSKARPWLHHDPERPRRAGVSAFGFGGTNFHAVLEAYDGNLTASPAPKRSWPAELFVWRAADHAHLLDQVERLAGAFDRGASPALPDLARATVVQAAECRDPASPTLALVATSLEDLRGKMAVALKLLRGGEAEIHDPRGIEYAEHPAFTGDRVAFLFPGQGSQSPEMLLDLTLAFPEVRDAFESFDAALTATGREPVGPKVFPPPVFDEAGRAAAVAALRKTEVAQPALGAASVAVLRLLGALGVEPHLLGGHSYGELVALHAAGALSLEVLAELSEARGRLMVGSFGAEPGAMAAVGVSVDSFGELLEGLGSVRPVNWNGPRQTVVAGPAEAIDRLVERARQARISARRLDVAGAFHTDAVAAAREPFAALVAARIEREPRLPVYSNIDAGRHPDRLEEIAGRMGNHLTEPVRFAPMVEAMYVDGARVFVEVGPGSVLTGLVGSILGDRPHLAASCDAPGRPGIPALLHALARLVVAGVPARLERLTAGRSGRTLDLSNLPAGDGSEPLPPSTWLVNGSRARPLDAPEPRRLGQAGIKPATSRPTSAKTAIRPARLEALEHTSPSTNGVNGIGKHQPLAVSTPKTSTPAPEPNDRVVSAFQETMRNFLEVQRATMLAFLGQPTAEAREVPAPTAKPAASPSQPMDRPEAKPRANPSSERPSSEVDRPAPTSEANALDRSAIADRLLAIVRDRTGYPAEMLRLDLDLEADLGIDSIKRVEILGTLRETLPELNRVTDSQTMDALSQARTMGAIVDRLARGTEQKRAAGRPEGGSRAGGVVRRMVLEPVACDLSNPGVGLLSGGLVLVTDDGRGVARGLIEELGAEGHPVVIAGSEGSGPSHEPIDLTSEASIDSLLDRLRARGPICAIVHALPLKSRSGSNLDVTSWSSRIDSEVKGLFLLARAAAGDLERAARLGGASLIAATSMGGAFGSVGRRPESFFPGQGGVTGLVKTLAHEWPSVRVRAIDFDPDVDPASIADRLSAEVLAADDWSEVGYQGDRRIRLRAVPRALGTSGRSRLSIRRGEPILISGGARGITAAVALELAWRWSPTLLLLGSSPEPTASESPVTEGLEGPALKAGLLARLRGERGEVQPAELERAFQETRRAREIRANLLAIREAGSVVAYAQADVRDPETLGRTLDHWRKRFGPPVGLIHGAGVIKDKLLRDKTPESFDRVLETKVLGALHLLRLLDTHSLRFSALFSSIAGRFGNLGQSDYAAANEILNKLAIWLDDRVPGRVLSAIWGPWSGVGMVSDLEGHLGRRGLGMIAPEVGRACLVDELEFGPKRFVEVLFAGELGGLDEPRSTAAIESEVAR